MLAKQKYISYIITDNNTIKKSENDCRSTLLHLPTLATHASACLYNYKGARPTWGRWGVYKRARIDRRSTTKDNTTSATAFHFSKSEVHTMLGTSFGAGTPFGTSLPRILRSDGTALVRYKRRLTTKRRLPKTGPAKNQRKNMMSQEQRPFRIKPIETRRGQ